MWQGGLSTGLQVHQGCAANRWSSPASSYDHCLGLGSNIMRRKHLHHANCFSSRVAHCVFIPFAKTGAPGLTFCVCEVCAVPCSMDVHGNEEVLW